MPRREIRRASSSWDSSLATELGSLVRDEFQVNAWISLLRHGDRLALLLVLLQELRIQISIVVDGFSPEGSVFSGRKIQHRIAPILIRKHGAEEFKAGSV